MKWDSGWYGAEVKRTDLSPNDTLKAGPVQAFLLRAAPSSALKQGQVDRFAHRGLCQHEMVYTKHCA